MRAVVVGHVTKDLIRIPGRQDRTLPGGSAFYVSAALARLGVQVKVVTKLAPSDAALVEPLKEAGVEVLALRSASTTVFENSYSGAQLSVRRQQVPSVADHFRAQDLDGLEADLIHLGPLTAQEMEPGVFSAARRVAPTVSFDAQGVLRQIEERVVVSVSPPNLPDLLAGVDILKVDDTEGTALTGRTDPEAAAAVLGDMGPSEVLVTFADRGSLLFTEGTLARIDAIPPAEIVDATGCGDTFLSGYVAARLQRTLPERAARLAAAAASLKLERYGPLAEGLEAVRVRAG